MGEGCKFPIPTVGALVRSPAGRLLLVRTQKWRGLWGVPGGKVEWGESLEDALRREFAEEVGLELHNIRFALFQEAINPPEFYQPAHFLLFNYFAESASEAIMPNEEIVEWIWVDKNIATSYQLNKYTTPLLRRYLEVADG